MRTAALRMAVQTWSPRSISGLKWWLKADGISGLTDGTAISTWSDSSGNGQDFTGSGTARPLYKTGIVNGRPVARFDGSNDIMSSAAAVDLSATAAVTVFAVFTSSAGSDQIVVEHSNNYNNFNDTFLLTRSSANAVFGGLCGGAPKYSVYQTTRTLTTTFRVVVMTMNRALSTNETTIYVDGNNGGSYVVNSDDTGNFGNRTTYIGARGAATAFPLNGDIAEIGCYTSALSSTDRINLQNYLGAKYGITIA